jgi:hypothetical protein
VTSRGRGFAARPEDGEWWSAGWEPGLSSRRQLGRLLGAILGNVGVLVGVRIPLVVGAHSRRPGHDDSRGNGAVEYQIEEFDDDAV